MGYGCDRIQFIWRKALSLVHSWSVQSWSGKLHDLTPACAEHDNHYAGQGFWEDTGWNRPDPSFWSGLAIPTQAISANAPEERHSEKYEPKRKLSGQCCDRKLLWPAQERASLSARVWIYGTFKQELVDYPDYYNNRRIKAMLKGLPPALHRQQALSVAWIISLSDICLTFWGQFSFRVLVSFLSALNILMKQETNVKPFLFSP